MRSEVESALGGGPKSGQETALEGLLEKWESRAERDLEERWRDQAEPFQLPPDGDWFVWIMQAGRGAGKSRAAGEWFHERAKKRQRKMMLAGRTPADVRDYALNGPGGLLTHHGDEIEYEPSKRTLTWPNDSIAHIRSGANPEEFRGFGGDTVWLDEFCAWKYPRESWNNLLFGVREGSPRICISTTPRPLDVFKEIREMENTVVARWSTTEMEEYLAEEWIENVIEPLRGTRLGRQEIEAEVLEEVEGALWSLPLIESGPEDRDLGGRIQPPEPMPPERLVRWLTSEHHVPLTRVVQGVDPSGGGHDVGNVVTAKGRCGYCGVDEEHAFVLADETCEADGAGWGQSVVDTFHRWSVDRIFGESNFGGDMVENTIRTVDGGEDVSYEDVSASRGKTVRAEPVASLYEQGKVHHVGAHDLLEDEMTSYVEGESDWSPNRMDALVWTLTELFDLQARRGKSGGRGLVFSTGR